MKLGHKEVPVSKQMILVAAIAAGAAASAFAPAAQAKGGHHHHFRGFHWTPSFSSSYDEPVVVRRRVIQKVYVEKQKVTEPTAKLIDGKGRQYDPAAKVWFDGKGQCWSGKEAFGFKSSNWFYGNARWYEINGSWKTNAAEAPATIDCEASPVIAAKLQGNAKPKDDTSSKDVGQNLDKAEPKKSTTTEVAPPMKVATEAPAPSAEAPKTAECKKYFPSVGEMLTVPCGQ
jgi:hypothetical protein